MTPKKGTTQTSHRAAESKTKIQGLRAHTGIRAGAMNTEQEIGLAYVMGLAEGMSSCKELS